MRIDEEQNTTYLITGIRIKRLDKTLSVVLSLVVLLLILCACGSTTNEVVQDEKELQDEVSSHEEVVDIDDEIHVDTSVSDSKVEKKDKIVVNNSNENEKLIFGEWKLESIALISEGFDDLSSEVYSNFDFDKYLNYDIIYSKDFIEIGDDKYVNPKYEIVMTTLAEYNSNGNYKSPDVYDFILNNGIVIMNQDSYEWLSEIPIESYSIVLSNGDYNPVVTYVLVLNEDTLLLGGWGKIFLAKRVVSLKNIIGTKYQPNISI